MQAKTLIKGLSIGIVAGSLLTAIALPMDKRHVKRGKAGRALKTVGQVIEGISDSIS